MCGQSRRAIKVAPKAKPKAEPSAAKKPKPVKRIKEQATPAEGSEQEAEPAPKAKSKSKRRKTG